MVRTESLKIHGMSCAACASASERAVRKLTGVEEAAVNFATEKLLVKFEDGRLGIEDIKAAVAKAGYEAIEEREDREVTIPIGGMSCAACAKSIERAVGKVSGVQTVSVNFATEKAAVRYDPLTARLSEIKQAIVKAGYAPLALEGPGRGGRAADVHKAAKEREIRALWTTFTVSAAFAIPLLYMAMGAMLGWPLPASISAMDHPLRYALLEIALVIPVIAAGHRFYAVGFSAIWRRSPNMDSLIAMGTSAAILYSLYSVFLIASGETKAVDSLYFETAGVIVTLILLGKSLEAVSKGRTSDSIKKLMGLQRKTATVIQGGAEIEMPIEEVEKGDLILVRPGEQHSGGWRDRLGQDLGGRVHAHRREHPGGERASATRSSARASTRTARSSSRRPRSERTRSSPASSSSSRTRKDRRRPSRGWRTRSPATSCR